MQEWIKYLRNKRFLSFLAGAIICLLIATTILTNLLTFKETNHGSTLNDPILNMFKPQDISIFIFIITYGTVLFGCISVLQYPKLALQTIITYAIILVFRIVTLYITPLDPPADIIPLRDYILEPTVYSNRVNLKDLFFSGHTAMAFMFYLLSKNKYQKIIFLLLTIVIGASVLIQHIHYTIDVLTAPLFVWLAVYLSKRIDKFV
jgi:membrane-associated phospholipid phosphatase